MNAATCIAIEVILVVVLVFIKAWRISPVRQPRWVEKQQTGIGTAYIGMWDE